MKTRRTVKIGKTSIIIENVPEHISDDELKTIAVKYIFEINKKKAIKEMEKKGEAS